MGPTGGPGRLLNGRSFTVDNVLQYSSDIPSGLPRLPPGQRPTRAAIRRSSHGTGLPNTSARTGQQIVPSRTTKVSEKLVLLPETPDNEDALGDEELERRASILRASEDDNRPLKDEEMDVLRKRGGLRGKSYAERLPKVQRGEKVSRLTAYCTAQAYKMQATAEFLKKKHEAKTKLYDDCLYTVYHLPLLPGVDGYRLRSRPILKTPGTGKTVLDLEIERSERRDEHEGYWDEYPFNMHGSADSPSNGTTLLQHAHSGVDETGAHSSDHDQKTLDHPPISPINRLAPDAKRFGEMFVFSYGVVVFWNFTEHQEKDILADLTFAENETGVSLATRPLDQNDFETEEFHFEYSADVDRPRVFNDMITLLPRSDHMVKLTISHAIAQSTKLCFFEERMSETMEGAQHVPKSLALTGKLDMDRTEVLKILGQLFKSRVDINLCKSTFCIQYGLIKLRLLTGVLVASNILEKPNFFWDSEPTLGPLYEAIRDYLEIETRTRVLNERCQVFLDLASILSDHVADAKMSYITWIIIILIVISIMVTVTEVLLRFAILSNEKAKDGANSPANVVGGGNLLTAHSRIDLRSLESKLANANLTLDDLRLWSAAMNEQEKKSICGAEIVGTTFKGL